MNNYIVQKGDTLYGIGKQFDVSVSSLIEENQLSSTSLKIGQVLKIPCNVENDYKTGEEYVMYTVVKNDSLYSIANKFNTTVDNIKKLNGLTNNNLSIGQKLIVDDKSGVSSVLECFGNGNFDNNNYINYMVVKGDNLYNLARKYNASVDQIKLVNNLKSNDLSVGQILKIPNMNSNTYTVQKGESLYSIAKKFNTTVDEIKKKNNLTSNLISVGKELII